jgi:hypothetical protein
MLFRDRAGQGTEQEQGAEQKPEQDRGQSTVVYRLYIVSDACGNSPVPLKKG